MTYKLLHLIDRHHSHGQHLQSVVSGESQSTSWGYFPGLFGLGTNEAYWIVMSGSPVLPEGIDVVQCVDITPTARPTEDRRRTKSGVYVFRWFEVDKDKQDRVVQLSTEAWQTFEAGFDTEVQGLFTVAPDMAVGQVNCSMLLVTWYQNLTVWQDSRAPDEAARSRFAARQALLNSAVPIATRLEEI